MLLGFKKRFEEPILEGTKIHTLREDVNNRWKRGNKIHFATGVRTKDYHQFKEGEVVSTQRVFMTYAYGCDLEISIDGKELNSFREKEILALNDGFDSWMEFFEWFYAAIKADPDEQFSGKIIHWTDLRY
jgi:uncharacterized protein YqfB (UPF0267 family)